MNDPLLELLVDIEEAPSYLHHFNLTILYNRGFYQKKWVLLQGQKVVCRSKIRRLCCSSFLVQRSARNGIPVAVFCFYSIQPNLQSTPENLT